MENPISSEVGFQELCRAGVALSVAKDIHKLLDCERGQVLRGCALRLCNKEKGCLDFSVVQNERIEARIGGESEWSSVPLSLDDGAENHENISAHCAITSQTINIADVDCGDGMIFVVPKSSIERLATVPDPCSWSPCGICKGM